MQIEQLYTGCLSQGAYYIESNGEALVIDPLRETAPYLQRAKRDKATITYIFETHFHADFVSGHVTLAKKTGAPIIFGPNATPTFDALIAQDGQEFKVGNITIIAIHTPGHTMESTTYLLRDGSGKEHAIFKQTDADVTSFDGGYGSAYLAKMVGQKKAREIFFLGRNYSAQDALDMGMVNAVIPHDELEATAYEWAQEILQKSPTSIKMLKFAMNLTDDGMVGQQVFAGEATRLAYMTEEAKEGRNAFLEKRKPNFEKKWLP